MIRKTTVIGLSTLLSTLFVSVKANAAVAFSNNAQQADKQHKERFIWTRQDFFDLDVALNDHEAVDWIAACSIIGLLMWFWGFLFYGPTNTDDKTMLYGEPPLAWFWMNLGSTTLGWTAMAYITWFFTYILVSVVEFLAWTFYISGDGYMLGLWVPWAQWGSLLLYFIPPFFSVLQLALPTTQGGINSNSAAGWTNAITMVIFGTANWLFQWIVHFIFTSRLVDHITAKEIITLKALCSCDKFVAPAGTKQSEIYSLFKAKHMECYKKLLRPKCQAVVQQAYYSDCKTQSAVDEMRENNTSFNACKNDLLKKCTQKRSADMTEAEYMTKCKAYDLTYTKQEAVKVPVEDASEEESQANPEEAW